ncbi:MAG: Asp-tRNA(Asn)/Glu-tRNA(Gln) amidotransferase GatCAB subunit C [Candidatus Zambryskibacteria bacterium CG10_big_fil_rev_8_21_14_0_10_42_12]|uniref:Aspartyl/glutamyl-tRNA(Asn/Gln) amidotransferase subunit C n=1 Tax=Candidatus Zambryskibacteria bacterium CG10_big_fil_rev_8_21_14_0_10_42_12 TaxID=1975115 RepID=A0A2H0QYG4_9BACT|nr:MAG: Asp-tRNA(Asn)/Glu-tRNA(Gln) amidotransferase GatCAB subunit C [Candidatus Zambryskibacteria bacterium CG10_big_fil_rev_8_21_14_0_10_42_12]
MIKKEDVLKLAQLARIETSEKEAEELAGDLDHILEYVSQVNSLDLSDEKEQTGPIFNVMRDDAHPHESGVHTEELLSASPAREGDYFKVKKIL